MEYFSRRRWNSGLAIAVIYSAREEVHFFASSVCASVLKLIYHRDDPLVHLFLPTCSMCKSKKCLGIGWVIFWMIVPMWRLFSIRLSILAWMFTSVTSKKLPSVYKSYPKMISPKTWKILTPLQKLPKNVGNLGKIIVATGFEKLPKVQ